MSSRNRPIILAFIGNYLPGYKAGGILRVTVNTVDHLCDEFEFKIVTRDRDLKDAEPYPDIKINQWQKVGNALVNYLPPNATTIRNINKMITNTPHNVLYLNSYFDPFTVMALLNRKLRWRSYKPVIVAPWGEFAWASLKQKYLKKFAFIQAARLFGLYKKVTWRASSEFEKTCIMKVMKIKSNAIQITADLPIKNIPARVFDITHLPPADIEELKIVFISRISREKNLDYALKLLGNVKARVLFDIYGPSENLIYWNECRELIEQLPANVKVKYLGSVEQDQVVNIFSRYDLFLFPTSGEAYGHVIAECLIAGTPVLISTETPWRDLQADGLGWDIELSQKDNFVDIIEKYAKMSDFERNKKRTIIKSKIAQRLADPAILESNRTLFRRE